MKNERSKFFGETSEILYMEGNKSSHSVRRETWPDNSRNFKQIWPRFHVVNVVIQQWREISNLLTLTFTFSGYTKNYRLSTFLIRLFKIIRLFNMKILTH